MKRLGVKIICFVLIFMSLLELSHISFGQEKKEVVHKIKSKDKKIALTFDDGGKIKDIEDILDILDEYDIKSTFFLIGSWVEKNKETTKEILSRGHEVGNHSYAHKDLKTLSKSEIENDLKKMKDAFTKATGEEIKPYVRPPYGSYTKDTEKILYNAGYEKIIMWSIDTKDWTGRSAEKITNEVLSKASSGGIVLMHLSPNIHTKEALPSIIEGLGKKGYEITTISALLDENKNKNIAGITYLEFLNNLMFYIGLEYSSTAQEVVEKAKNVGIVEENIEKLLYKKIKKEKAVEYTCKAINIKPLESFGSDFTDVPLNMDNTGYLNAAKKLGIINGKIEEKNNKLIFGYGEYISKDTMNILLKRIEKYSKKF